MCGCRVSLSQDRGGGDGPGPPTARRELRGGRICTRVLSVPPTAPEGERYHPRFTQGETEAQRERYLGPGHTAVEGGPRPRQVLARKSQALGWQGLQHGLAMARDLKREPREAPLSIHTSLVRVWGLQQHSRQPSDP